MSSVSVLQGLAQALEEIGKAVHVVGWGEALHQECASEGSVCPRVKDN